MKDSIRPSDETEMAPTGTQSIGRAVAMLRLIASRSPRGARLVDLAAASGMARPTARRILKCLVGERLAMQDPKTRRYGLGSLAFELGLAAAQKPPILEACRPLLTRLADLTGDTVYLVMRSGVEAVCIDRREGSFPIKTMTLEPGGRSPLGIGAGSLALLAALDDAEVDEITARNAGRLARFHAATPEALRRTLVETRRLGYSVTRDVITPGVSGIGMVIGNGSAAPVAAVSVAAISARMTSDRLRQLAQLLRAELAALR